MVPARQSFGLTSMPAEPATRSIGRILRQHRLAPARRRPGRRSPHLKSSSRAQETIRSPQRHFNKAGLGAAWFYIGLMILIAAALLGWLIGTRGHIFE